MTRDLIIADSARITARKVFGEEITILADNTQTGSYEIYVHDAPEGVGPPPHSHPWDEAFYVIEGKVDFVLIGWVCACSGRNGSYVPIRQPRARTGHHFGQRSSCDVHCY